MSDVFAAPGADAPGDRYDGPWIMICQGVLAFCGAVYGLLGIVAGGAYTIVPLIAASEEPEMIVMVPFGIIILLISLVVAGANFLAVWGLGAHKQWGWIIALILTAMYLPSGCMPLGAVLAYGLLVDEPTRKVFFK